MKDISIGLIFRVPEIGNVKKRLEKVLGAEKTYIFYKQMLDETIKKILNYEKADLYGFYKGDKEKIDYNINLIEQKSDDLGQIILDSISSLIDKSYKKIVILGSDSPDLPLDFISKSFEYLDDTDIVIGPSEDGGFYLLGCKKNFNSKIFKNVEWGSFTVLNTIKNNLKILNLRYKELPLWYDIDDLSSLKRYFLNNHNSIPSSLFSDVKGVISPFDSFI